MRLTDIWPALGTLPGRKRLGELRNRSNTKKGPGRLHLQGRPAKVEPDPEGKTVVVAR